MAKTIATQYGEFLKKNGGKSAVQVEPDYDDDDTEIVENDDYPDYLDENKGDD